MTIPFNSRRNSGGRRSRNSSSSNSHNAARSGPLWEYLSYVSVQQQIQAYFDAETVMAHTNHRQMAHQAGSCPPASVEAISRLPSVRVLPIDKIAGKNDKEECGICCERLVDGVALTRLPCGHVFHITCGVKWLQESCTCPECRYELPTRDPVYEIGRRERMKNRKTFVCSCKPCSYHTCFFDANHAASVNLESRATVVPPPSAEELSAD
jgi:Ring finger domain